MAIEQAFAPPENIAYTSPDGQLNSDIRDTLEKNFRTKAIKQAAQSAKIFKGKTPAETAKLIWLYLRNHCKYRKDLPTHQIIRNPSYFVNSKPPTGDCKTFATFARAVYSAIYPQFATAFKYTGYRPGQKQPSHVYTVVKDGNGNDIVIDGCWHQFNDEKEYTFAIQPKFESMRISVLSGQSDSLLDAINDDVDAIRRKRIAKLARLRQKLNTAQAELDGGHITRAQFMESINAVKSEAANAYQEFAKNLTPEQKKIVEKSKRRAKRRRAFGKLQHGFNLINLAPVRAGFLSFVAMNINGFANKLAVADKLKGGNKIYDVWYKFGGIKKMLKKAIAKGAKNKPLFLSKKKRQQYEQMKKKAAAAGVDMRGKKKKGIAGTDDDGIGVAPAVVAAIIAAATAIISAMIPIVLKVLENNGKKKEAAEVAAQGKEIVDADRRGEGYQRAFSDEGAQEPSSNEPDEPMFDDIGNMSADQQAQLISNLSQIAGKGVEYLGNYIAKKADKNPKLRSVLQKGATAADDYFTGMYVRKAGYKNAWQSATSMLSNPMFMLAGAGIIGAGLYFATSKKK